VPLSLDACRYEDAECRGYVVTAPKGWLRDHHIAAVWLAGVFYWPDAIQDPTFAPGNPITVTPEPDNPFDSNALGVWNADRSIQAGFVPRIIGSWLGASPTPRVGLVLREHLEDGRRVALDLVIARGPVVLYVKEDQDEAMLRHVRRVVNESKQHQRNSRAPRDPPGDPVAQMMVMLEGLPSRYRGAHSQSVAALDSGVTRPEPETRPEL
jgi:hypothetical protein